MDDAPPQRRRHDQVLADIARLAGSSLELEEVLERIVQRAATLTGADRASILLLDGTGRRLIPSALWGMDVAFTTAWKTRPVWLEDEPLSKEVLSTGLPVAVAAAALDPRTDKRSVAFFGDQSILVAPLTRRGHHLGTLFLNHVRLPYAFTADDVETTGAIANQAAFAVEHAQLYARLQEEQRRAQQAERSRTDFVSMVSHELRTPLALVKAYIATLLQPELRIPPQQARSFMEGINQATDRLQHLIDNLLSATSLDAGLFVSRPAPLEVGEMLREAVEDVAMLVGGRTLLLDEAPGELWVLGDKQQLTQVIENLVTNAVKYAPGETPVTIGVSASERHVRISVRDAGPGIPPAALDLVFEKFYRLTTREFEPAGAGEDARAAGATGPAGGRGHAGDRGRPGGMGLGLYICRRIVQSHGGRIWAESPPSGGAAFYVELPRGTTTESTAIPTAATEPSVADH